MSDGYVGFHFLILSFYNFEDFPTKKLKGKRKKWDQVIILGLEKEID